MNQSSTTSAHTPWPWSLNNNEVYGDDGRTFVAEVFQENESWKANARLIAAAPVLLNTCQYVHSMLKEKGGHWDEMQQLEGTFAEVEGRVFEGTEVSEEVRDIFRLTTTDAQDAALHKIGRTLTHEELRRVKRNFEWGIGEQWLDIIEMAIDEALQV